MKTMERTVEWIIERAKARIADRVECRIEVTDNRDVYFHHEETEAMFGIRSLAWGNADNSDESVKKKINREVDHFLEQVAKKIKLLRERDNAFAPERPANQYLPAPAARKRGRPPMKKKPVTDLAGAEKAAVT